MNTKTCYQLGLLGRNISYSLSPRIHLTSARLLGLQLKYHVLDLTDEELSHFFACEQANLYTGFSVTTPYKSVVANTCQALCREESINTLHFNNGAWSGYSTDAPGLHNTLKVWGKSLTNYPYILIIGSGGVVSGVLAYIQENQHTSSKPPQVSIFARNKIIRENLAHNFNAIEISSYDLNPLCLEEKISQPLELNLETFSSHDSSSS